MRKPKNCFLIIKYSVKTTNWSDETVAYSLENPSIDSINPSKSSMALANMNTQGYIACQATVSGSTKILIIS